jgi:hypothetical protein
MEGFRTALAFQAFGGVQQNEGDTPPNIIGAMMFGFGESIAPAPQSYLPVRSFGPGGLVLAGAEIFEGGWELGPADWIAAGGLVVAGGIYYAVEHRRGAPPPANTPSASASTAGAPAPGGQDQKSNQRMTNKEAREQAKKLGYDKEVKNAPFKSQGNKVFTNGKNFISADRDMHSGGAWKMFNRAGQRLGTYDINLVRIGD